MKKLAQGFNTTAQDSNPGSLSRESGTLPMSHCALRMYVSMYVCMYVCMYVYIYICMYPLHIQSPMQSSNARQVMIEIGQIYDVYYIR